MTYPTIAATGTAVPPHTRDRDAVKTYIGRVFSLDERRLDAMMAVIDNAQIETRRSIVPVGYIVAPRTLAQKSVEYQEHAVRLGRDAAERCLARAGIIAPDVDMIITVSRTGFMIPSLDAHLINTMGFRADVRRLPITELGCPAGARAAFRVDGGLARGRARRGGGRGALVPTTACSCPMSGTDLARRVGSRGRAPARCEPSAKRERRRE